jgi:hypothetical protein
MSLALYSARVRSSDLLGITLEMTLRVWLCAEMAARHVTTR